MVVMMVIVGMGLSITLNAGKRDAQVAVGSRGSVVRVLAAKAGGPGFDLRQLPWVFFLFQLAYTNANG